MGKNSSRQDFFFIERLRSFAYARLALVSLGEITLEEATWLIDANADGMFEVLQDQGQWQQIALLEEVRADLREGIKAKFGALPKELGAAREVVVETAAQLRAEVQNVTSLLHRQNRLTIREMLLS